MDYDQLRNMVWPYFTAGDFARGYSVLDDLLATDSGPALGQAMVLKASVIATFDLKRIPEGLALIDEALPLIKRHPGIYARALKIGLALAYFAGDTERAQPYEEAACGYLLEHGTDPEVRAERFGVQLNLGLVASLRGDHATAYWYLVQASNSLSAPEVTEERRMWSEFSIQTSIALSCLRVRRYYEAQEALDLADACGQSHPQRLRAPVYRSELLRQLGQAEDARELLNKIRAEVEVLDNPDIQAWYYWISALVAQDLGNLPEYHKNLAIAQETAATHHFDYLLGQIQRATRSSIRSL